MRFTIEYSVEIDNDPFKERYNGTFVVTAVDLKAALNIVKNKLDDICPCYGKTRTMEFTVRDEVDIYTEPSDENTKRIVDEFTKVGKINAIKLSREIYGLPLKEAKDMVDKLEMEHNLKSPASRW